MMVYVKYLLSLCACIVLTGMSYAATIKVGANYPVKSITKALQQAQEGDIGRRE
jgi:hypothetical protein